MSVRTSKSTPPASRPSSPARSSEREPQALSKLRQLDATLEKSSDKPTGKLLYKQRKGQFDLKDSDEVVRKKANGQPAVDVGVKNATLDVWASLVDLEEQERQRPLRDRSPELMRSTHAAKTLLKKSSAGVEDTKELRAAVKTVVTLHERRESNSSRNSSPSRVTAKRRPRPAGKENAVPRTDNLEALQRVSHARDVAKSMMIDRRKELLAAGKQGLASFSTNLKLDAMQAEKLNRFVKSGTQATKDEEQNMLTFIEASAKAECMDARHVIGHLLVDTAMSAYLNDATFEALLRLHDAEMMKLVPEPR